jgi:hypothetical protein
MRSICCYVVSSKNTTVKNSSQAAGANSIS